MDTLIKWAIYGVMAAAVLAAITLAWHTFVIAPAEARGATLQAAKDAPIVAGLTKQRDEAITANKTLADGVGKLQEQVDAAHVAWVAANTAAQTQRAQAIAAIAAAKASTTLAMNQVRALAALAATVPTSESEEAQCEDARGILSALAVDRRMLH